jgi:hypothetical protein
VRVACDALRVIFHAALKKGAAVMSLNFRLIAKRNPNSTSSERRRVRASPGFLAGGAALVIALVFAMGATTGIAEAACANVICDNNGNWQHIHDEHCDQVCASSGDSEFKFSICKSLQALQDFCALIVGSNSCQQTVYANHIVATTTGFGNGIIIGKDRSGCLNTKSATVIYYQNANPPRVQTMYPGKPLAAHLKDDIWNK